MFEFLRKHADTIDAINCLVLWVFFTGVFFGALLT